MTVLSAVYGGVARLRRSWYERHPDARRTLDVPVISVGNLTVGGSGKTPVVASLARLLQSMGHHPGVLSRGYARRHVSDGVLVVSDGERVHADAAHSGDEPQMLARMLDGVPVLVASDRYVAGRLAEQQFGCTVLLLDDGFQHLQLSRTVDLVIVSPSDLDDRVLPSGRLREPVDAARLADALLVPGTTDQAMRVSAAVGVPVAFTLTTQFHPIRPLTRRAGPSGPAKPDPSGPAGPGPSGPAGTRRVIAVAGIARPQRFVDGLEAEGYDVARTFTFRDHHWFTPADVARIEDAAREEGVGLIVTTEKDAARLTATAPAWAVLPITVTIEPAEAFAEWLKARV